MKIMKNRGFTFIDILVGSALALIIFVGVYGAYQLGLKVISQSKSQITAVAIASGELEQIKNLAYNVVGIIGGFPDGTLEGIKIKNINGTDYSINTRVDYVIDSADGISDPLDTCPNDYKKVEIEVSWTHRLSGSIKLVTDIMPDNLAQECADEGGILLISVFDAFGVAVLSPLIEIKDKDTDDIIKTALPSSGTHFFSLSVDSYKVVVSKSGYSSSRTYGVAEIANPERPHLTVLDGQLTESSFSIDLVSVMDIETVGPASLEYPIISNASFNLRGGKILGTDIAENPVYKYIADLITNESGEIVVSDLEWDLYTFTPETLNLIAVESPVEIVIEQPINLAPNVTQNIRLVLEADNSLLFNVRDSVTFLPIFSATVRLYNLGILYDITQYTDEDGKTYFVPLVAETYNIDIDLVGYNSYTGSTVVSGNQLKVVNLERIE